MARSVLYVGNRLPTLTATLTDASEIPIDLTGATIQFALRGAYATANLFKNTATIVGSATNGQVKYDLATNDLATAVPGLYVGRWIVTIGGKVEDIPAGEFELRSSYA